MKQRTDPRHLHRQQLVQDLFSYGFHPSEDRQGIAGEVIAYLNDLDKLISVNAPEWPLEQINRVDLSVLRLAIYELEHSETPTKVVIDEAVELAKEFGSQSSAKFVNGVLGSYIKDKKSK